MTVRLIDLIDNELRKLFDRKTFKISKKNSNDELKNLIRRLKNGESLFVPNTEKDNSEPVTIDVKDKLADIAEFFVEAHEYSKTQQCQIKKRIIKYLNRLDLEIESPEKHKHSDTTKTKRPEPRKDNHRHDLNNANVQPPKLSTLVKQTALTRKENIEKIKSKNIETIKNELSEYIKNLKERTTEYKRFSIFGRLKGMSKTVKLDAACKMYRLISNPKLEITFTAKDMEALRDGELGLIIHDAEQIERKHGIHLLPEKFKRSEKEFNRGFSLLRAMK